MTVSDLISRADAIEAVIEYWDGYAKPLDSWDVMNQTRAVLETLPSAEPITSGYIADDKEVPPYTTTSAISAEAVQGWIPCSERLPLASGEFLVTLVDNDGTWVSTAQWSTTFGGRWQDIFPNDGYRDISNVIAWKTLPTPYKGGDDE